MRIRVTKTTRAARDGVAVRSYRAGETYDLPEDLARVFLREGWGREADAPASKALDSAPENETPPNPRRAKRRRRRRKRAPTGQ